MKRTATINKDRYINPLISVLMAVYNGEKYLAEAISSILNQTYSNFEFIIIDDFSNDSSHTIIESFHDSRIRTIKNEENIGLAKSLNKGIRIAKGVYIARMDADDVALPERFEKQIKWFRRNRDCILCGTFFKILGNSSVIKVPVDNDTIKINLLVKNQIAHPTVMVLKEFLFNHNLFYNENFNTSQDYELWTRIVLLGEVGNVPEPLLLYRIHANQITIEKKQLVSSITAEIQYNYFFALYNLNFNGPVKPNKELFILSMNPSGTLTLTTINLLFEFLNIFKNNIQYNKNTIDAFIDSRKKNIAIYYLYNKYLNCKPFRIEQILNYYKEPKYIRKYVSYNSTIRFIVKSILKIRN